jgi:DNA-binding CsgD family transcriptional regulator
LTPSERDTASLAAVGHSNKQIATHFGVSIRTVESRLQQVYTKLGISSRADIGRHLKLPGNKQGLPTVWQAKIS